MADEEQKRFSFHYDYVVVVVLYLWSIVYIVASKGINSAGARLFPYIVIALTVGLSTILLIKILFRIGKVDEYDFSGTGRAVALMGLMLIYITAITFVGFYIATPFFLYGTMFALGQRNHKIILACSVILPLFVYLLFDLTLNLQIPGITIF